MANHLLKTASYKLKFHQYVLFLYEYPIGHSQVDKSHSKSHLVLWKLSVQSLVERT